MPIILPPPRRWLVAALTFILAHAVVPDAGAAQRQPVAGTRVMLEPPAGFTPSDRFLGFGNDAALSSIIVTEMEAPFSQMDARMTPEAFAAQGMTVHTSDTLSVDGSPGRLLSMTQDVGGASFGKWALTFGDDTMTTFVSATFPSDSAALGEALKRSVLSARLREAPADPLEGLGFAVDTGSRLRIATRMGNNIALTETGELPDGPGAPFLVIGRSVSEADMRDVEAFARWRMNDIGSQMTVTGVTGGGPVDIGGAAAYELFADAVHGEGPTPVKVYQVVVPDGNHYLLLIGFVGADRAAELIPEFQAVARTLRRTP